MTICSVIFLVEGGEGVTINFSMLMFTTDVILKGKYLPRPDQQFYIKIMKF